MKFIEVEHPAIGKTVVPETAVEHLGDGWKVNGESTSAGPAAEPFDPTDHTVAEVTEYLAYASPEERDRVLQVEQDGKARAGIVGA
ncbi:MAG: hypothetical protein ACXVW0_07575 [Nocardioides sp.]